MVVTDINDYRLDLAKACGATLAINVSKGNSVELLKDSMKQLGEEKNMIRGWSILTFSPPLPIKA